MRLMILTDNKNRHFYFCNNLILYTDSVIGVILGGKSKKNSLFYRIKIILTSKYNIIFKKFINLFLNIVYYNYGKIFKFEKNKYENKYF